MLIAISIALILTLSKAVYDLVEEKNSLIKDYNVLLGSYKQIVQVLVAGGYLKQEEYDRFIENKKEKEV